MERASPYYDIDAATFANHISGFLPKGRTGADTYLNTADDTSPDIHGARGKDYPVEVVVDAAAETVRVTRELWETIDAPEYEEQGADRAAELAETLAAAGFEPTVEWQGDFYAISVTVSYGEASLAAVYPATVLAVLTFARCDTRIEGVNPRPQDTPTIPEQH